VQLILLSSTGFDKPLNPREPNVLDQLINHNLCWLLPMPQFQQDFAFYQTQAKPC
jgi:hypothetical protein